MPEPDSSTLWRAIADQLRAEIKNGLYAPGAPLPGEIAMAERYHTSRPTVRRAIAELAGEGLVTAAHGRGTFTRPRPERMSILTGGENHPDLLAPDYHPITWHFTREPEPLNQITGADRDQADSLAIKTGEPIIHRAQQWHHDPTGRTITLTSATPARLLGADHSTGTLPAPIEVFDVYHALMQTNPITLFTTAITARMPQGEELARFGIETGTPLLQITRTMTDFHGRPLEATVIHAPADRFDAAATADRPILSL